MIVALAMIAALAAPPKAPAPPRVSARVAVVADLDTGKVIYQKASTRVHSIASISKLVAMRVVWMRGLDLNATTVMTKSDAKLTRGGARSRLVTGRAYKNRDLIHAALLGSDNRAVLALGRTVGLDVREFAAAMNVEAKILGLPNTRFRDPTGINHANKSTGVEVLGVLRSVLSIPELAAITRLGKWRTVAKERSGIALIYRNTNALTRGKTRRVLAGKTGFNSAAGWCVTTAVHLPNGRRVAIIVLGSPTKYMRFADSYKLERWVAKQPWKPPEPVPETIPAIPRG